MKITLNKQPAMKTINHHIVVLLAAAAVWLTLPSAEAASRSWTNTNATGYWDVNTNWTGSTIPATGDNVYIYRTVSAFLTNDAGSITTLYMGSTDGVAKLTVSTNGVIEVTNTNGIRLGNVTNSEASLVIDGGTVNYTGGGRLFVGNSNNTTSTLTIKNGGTLNGGYIGLSSQNYQIATLNIGGEGTPEAPGFANVSQVAGSAATIVTNTVNFNHTSSRYEFTNSTGHVPIGSSGSANIYVNIKAGTTVLAGTNRYTDGTTVHSNAVLLANFGVSNATYSSTGVGDVVVNGGGVLGGVGYVGGDTTVSGILKPGDYDYGAGLGHGQLKFHKDLTLASSSTTIIGIDGAGGSIYDSFKVAGTLTLDGTLKVDLLSGFSISDGQTLSFQLISTTNAISGSYASYDLAAAWGGLDLTWDTSKINSLGSLSVAAAVPEPGTVTLFLAGAAALTLLARRRQR